MRICTECKTEKPATTKYFYKAGIGLETKCKECRLSKFKQNRVENHDKFLSRDKEARDKHQDKIKAYHKEYNKVNSEKRSLVRRKRYADNKEKELEINKKWALLNKEKRSNDSKYHYIKTRDERLLQCKAWKNSNKHKVNSYAAKRRSAELLAVPLWFEATNVQRLYLDARLSGKHVDHIVPLISDKVCGLHCLSNLRVISAKENLSKNNRYWPDMP